MNLPKHWRTLLVLFLLIIGGTASAAGCESNIPTATDARMNIESFVPDPGCWVIEVKTKLDQYQTTAFAENLGKGLLFAFGAVGVIFAQSTGSWNNWLIRLGYSAVAFAMINGYSAGNGIGATISSTMMQGWQQGYIQSARLGNADLNSTITDTTAELSVSVAEYMVSTTTLRSYQELAEAMGPLSDPESMDRILTDYANKNEERRTSMANANPFKGITANLTYVLLIGFHGVFASIIFSSGLMMVLLDMLFPLIVAVAAIGMPSAAWGAFALSIGNILVVIITPAMMGILTGVALRAPLESMNQSMKVNVANVQDGLRNVQSQWQGCMSLIDPDFLDRAKSCMTATTSMINPANNLGSSINDTMIGLGLAGVAAIIAFATMMLQLRRVPAIVMQVVGTAGGGESSGVGSNPVTAAASKAAGMTTKAVMAKATGGTSLSAGAAAKAAGGKNNGGNNR